VAHPQYPSPPARWESAGFRADVRVHKSDAPTYSTTVDMKPTDDDDSCAGARCGAVEGAGQRLHSCMVFMHASPAAVQGCAHAAAGQLSHLRPMRSLPVASGHILKWEPAKPSVLACPSSASLTGARHAYLAAEGGRTACGLQSLRLAGMVLCSSRRKTKSP
jgi:hypothetical protein